MAEVSFYIANGNHDTGYEATGGVFSASGSTTSLYHSSSVNHKTSLLFQGVNIPQGTTITNARLRVFPSNNNAVSNMGILIYANDEDDASAPTSASEFAALQLTTAYLVHTTVATTWNTAKNGNTYYNILDSGTVGYLKAVIQEVLNRPGWVSGNDLQLVLLGANTDDSNTRSIKTYENNPSYVAQLTLWYTLSLTVNGEIESVGAEFFGAYDNQYPGDISTQGCELGGARIPGMLGLHPQETTLSSIIVTSEPPHGSLVLSDDKDAFAFESGAGIVLEDELDTFALTAAFGTFGTLSLLDSEDVFASLPGGDISIQDANDTFTLTGTSEALAVCSWGDSLDTMELQALPGSLADLDVVDASDLLSMTGTPETTGGMNLVDGLDTFTLQAMSGIAASGPVLVDGLDAMSFTAAPEETGALALMDASDLFQFVGGTITRFATHIIQYQKTRY